MSLFLPDVKSGLRFQMEATRTTPARGIGKRIFPQAQS
jgi:hypothetical protein